MQPSVDVASHLHIILKRITSLTYFVDLTGVGGDVVFGLYERAAGVVEERTDEQSKREDITGRGCSSWHELYVWSDEVKVWLSHLGLLRRPRNTLHARTRHMQRISVLGTRATLSLSCNVASIQK